MSDNKNESQPSIFQKAKEASSAWLDMQIRKASNDIAKKQSDNSDFVYGKSIIDEPSYAINSQGYKEKPHRILNTHLKQMSLKDSIVAGIIQNRQNQVASHSKLVKSEQDRGFMIILKDEESFLKKIKDELKKDIKSSETKETTPEEDQSLDSEVEKALRKAVAEVYSDQENENGGIESDVDDSDDQKGDDEVEEINWEIERKAKAKLEESIRDRRKIVEDYIIYCGYLEGRPFETKKWNFDSALRAWTRDSLTYDFVTSEVVPNKVNKPHHFFPSDSSTIKFSSPSLKKYKMFPGGQSNIDLMYPEKQIEALERKDALELDDKLLEDEKYKYVQVIRGRIERAYTEDEMKIGMRNMTTDIYNNGYGVSELELLVSLVASHLNTEYYNKSYFTQGFSAKGILHLKAPIPRRKLETIRQQWYHMIRGSRNSFQTPIFAGMDEVNWIPLTQNHTDIEFSGWMNYLIKMICSVYQIDPFEVGIGMKDEGSKGGISGDNTQEKINASKDKGLKPLLRFLENYINTSFIDMIDSDFCLRFTGIDAESGKEALERQEKEVKFKKTVNEIRAEDNLPPLPGMDDILLDPNYIQWYTQFSNKGVALAAQSQAAEGGPGEMPGEEGEDSGVPTDEELDEVLNTPDQPDDISKSVKIEYYKIK